MALVVEQSPPVGKPGRIGNFRVSPPDCGRDVTGLHVSQEKPVLDFSVFTWDENRTPIRRPPYRSPDKASVAGRPRSSPVLSERIEMTSGRCPIRPGRRLEM